MSGCSFMAASGEPLERKFTRPMNSSMIFGLLPAAVMRVGFSMSVGDAHHRLQPLRLRLQLADFGIGQTDRSHT
jgi:hypothetical protein